MRKSKATATLPLPEGFREFLQEIHESPSLEDFPQYEALRAFYEEVGPELAAQLTLYSKLLDPSRFVPRILVYRKPEKKNKHPAMALVQPAPGEFLRGSLTELRAVMDSASEALCDETSYPCLWVSPAPGEQPAFLLFARFRDGFESLSLCHENKFVELPVHEKFREMALQSLLRVDEEDEAIWKTLMEVFVTHGKAHGYGEVLSKLQEHGIESFPEEAWGEALETIAASDWYRTHQEESLRALSAKAVHEAHYILSRVRRVYDGAKEFFGGHIAEMERTHAREMRKMRKSLELYKMARQGAEKRSRQLTAELAQARQTLRQSQAREPAAAQGADRLAQALDAFFDSSAPAHCADEP